MLFMHTLLWKNPYRQNSISNNTIKVKKIELKSNVWYTGLIESLKRILATSRVFLFLYEFYEIASDYIFRSGLFFSPAVWKIKKSDSISSTNFFWFKLVAYLAIPSKSSPYCTIASFLFLSVSLEMSCYISNLYLKDCVIFFTWE